jgi:carbon-monoxide dehydrogenase large subunit
VAVVEVDTETGKVILRRVVTVNDAGTIINPLLAGGHSRPSCRRETG